MPKRKLVGLKERNGDLTRMNITTSEDHLELIDIRAAAMGLTRSAFVRLMLERNWDARLKDHFNPHISLFSMLVKSIYLLEAIHEKFKLEGDVLEEHLRTMKDLRNAVDLMKKKVKLFVADAKTGQDRPC